MEKAKDNLNLQDSDMIDIKNNYYASLKDEAFKTLVSKLETTDEVKMKYTSSLMDASYEFSHCMSCPGLSECKNKIKGFMYTPVATDKSIIFEYKACDYKKKEISDNKYLDNIELFEMTSSLKKASIKDMYTNDKERLEIVKYFKKFIDNYGKNKVKGLYLHGSFGAGKTYLIAALFNEMAKRNVKSVIVYYPEFLRSLKESFESGFKEKFNYVRRVPLLLLDDIGAETVSEWNRDEILGSILQYRMEEGLPTFFTSNLTIEELEEHFAMTNRGIDKVKARRIIERVKYITEELKLVSVDRRNKNAK